MSNTIYNLIDSMRLEQSLDRVSSKIDSIPKTVNPNLIDNWYFGNPVNQRIRAIIGPGHDYYDPSNKDTPVGTTTKWYYLLWSDGEWAAVIINNTAFLVKAADCVIGHLSGGFTIDRWSMRSAVLYYTTNGCIFQYFAGGGGGGGYYSLSQKIEGLDTSRKYTLSIVLDGELISSNDHSIPILLRMPGGTIDCTSNNGMVSVLISCYPNMDASHTITAIKLEMGEQQTLAHKEGDSWILNEIPDYGEQLLKCQRYFVRSTMMGVGYASNILGNFISVKERFPVRMRTTPTITIYGDGAYSNESKNKLAKLWEGSLFENLTVAADRNVYTDGFNCLTITGDIPTTDVAFYYDASADI